MAQELELNYYIIDHTNTDGECTSYYYTAYTPAAAFADWRCRMIEDGEIETNDPANAHNGVEVYKVPPLPTIAGPVDGWDMPSRFSLDYGDLTTRAVRASRATVVEN
jgi:hypothetical protein